MVARFITITAFFILVIVSVSVAIDQPHTSDLNVTCASCHNPSITFTFATIDNTPWNEICWSCHDFGMSGSIFEDDTHSAISTGDDVVKKYWGGEWTNECRRCHDPHTNEQARSYQGVYPTGAWLYTGTIQSSTYNTITVVGSPWVDDELIGKTLHPKAGGSYLYRIVDNTSNTIVVAGSMFPFTRIAGGTFAISYGKLIRAEINTGSYADKFRTVKFLNSSGTSSFADGDGAYDGICEICHSLPSHFRRDGSGSDQLHANMGSQAGGDCSICHFHEKGFYYAGHSEFPGPGCEPCHGHDAGYELSPGEFSQGTGTSGSHSTHTEDDGDDAKGPKIACEDCHDTAEYPYFKSGTDGDSDGKYDLSETDVCDNCHSPGGSYDGVNDGVIGAKNNWDGGVYVSNILPAGKEFWCVGCHDDSPANSNQDGTGVNAPNVIGDNAAYGFYATGHGRNARVDCTDCHDTLAGHIDHDHRTYDAGVTQYCDGYRLRYIGGLPSMVVPRPSSGALDNWRHFALCLTCHDKYNVIGTSSSDVSNTNFWDNDATPNNSHWYHLGMSNIFDSDFDGTLDSAPSCVTCHNVHGSPTGPMIRHGELISSPGSTNKVPAFNFTYFLPGDGSATATFAPALAGGTYDVYAWWTAHTNRADNAKYLINHDGGQTEAVVNQKINGSQWNLLGQYAFSSGIGNVVLTSDGANGYIMADAVRWYRTDGLEEVIVDDNAASYTGLWTEDSNVDAYETMQRYVFAPITDHTLPTSESMGGKLQSGGYNSNHVCNT